MANIDPEVYKLAEAIERYLMEHPQAADSVEGIAGWWLSQYCGSHRKEDVVVALDALIGRGVVVSMKSANGHLLYCAKRKYEPTNEQ